MAKNQYCLICRSAVSCTSFRKHISGHFQVQTLLFAVWFKILDRWWGCDSFHFLLSNTISLIYFQWIHYCVHCSQTQTLTYINTHTPFHVLKSSRYCTIDIVTRAKHIELEQNLNSTLVRARYAFDSIWFDSIRFDSIHSMHGVLNAENSDGMTVSCIWLGIFVYLRLHLKCMENFHIRTRFSVANNILSLVFISELFMVYTYTKSHSYVYTEYIVSVQWDKQNSLAPKVPAKHLPTIFGESYHKKFIDNPINRWSLSICVAI